MIYANDNTPQCCTCLHGQEAPDNGEFICTYHGVVAFNHACKRYQYDVFKRRVRRKKRNAKEYTASDFSID